MLQSLFLPLIIWCTFYTGRCTRLGYLVPEALITSHSSKTDLEFFCLSNTKPTWIEDWTFYDKTYLRTLGEDSRKAVVTYGEHTRQLSVGCKGSDESGKSFLANTTVFIAGILTTHSIQILLLVYFLFIYLFIFLAVGSRFNR